MLCWYKILNMLAFLLESARVRAQGSGGRVSPQRLQAEAAGFTSCLQSSDAAFPVEREGLPRQPLPVPSAVWLQRAGR